MHTLRHVGHGVGCYHITRYTFYTTCCFSLLPLDITTYLYVIYTLMKDADYCLLYLILIIADREDAARRARRVTRRDAAYARRRR